MSDKRPAPTPAEEPSADAKKPKLQDAKAAETAKQKVPPPALPAVDLKLDPEEDEPSPASKHEQLTTANIILFGLHPLANQTNLKKFLQPYGALKKLQVKMAFSSKYGLVEFETLDDAQATLEKLNGRKILGKQLVVKGEGNKSQPRSDIAA